MITITFFIDRLTGSDGLTGGTERQLLELIEHMDKNHFTPILIVLRGDNHNEFWNKLWCEKYLLDVKKLLSIKGIIALFRTAHLLHRIKTTFVHTFFFDATVFGVLAAKLAGVGWIISSRRDMGFWYRKSLIKTLKIVNKFTDRILVNSNSIREAVVTHENVSLSKITVLYNGIDLHKINSIKPASEYRQRIGLHDGVTVYGIAANFNRPVKRIDLFIKAARIAVDKNPQLRFIIVGEGQQETELRTLTYELKLEQHIIFAGKHDNPIPIMKLFEIGVLTSDSEGLPNTVLQYMSLGIPTVSTNAGGVNEIITHEQNGLLVPCGDVRALGAAFLRLTNVNLRKQLGNRARESVSRFNWPRIIRKYEFFYKSLLTG